MSTTTAAHVATELFFAGADDQTGIVTFTAPSAHDAGRVNAVSLDTTDGTTHCDCKGAECGRRCWHQDWIAAAWLASPPMQEVRWMTDASLLRFGSARAAWVAVYRARSGRALPEHAAALCAARSEWRWRQARGLIERVAVAVAA